VREARTRHVLYAVDAAATGAGLRPGMALADARAMVPTLATAPARPAEDKRALARLAGWCGRYSPWTAAGEPATDADGPAALGLENGGGAGLWLDVTGCAHLFGGEDAMLDDVVGRIGGLSFAVRAAMADTPGGAWAVARYAPCHAPGTVVPPGGTRDALAGLPVAALRLAPVDAAGLHGLGLKRIGDLYDLPRAPLVARFGNDVMRRLDAALGDAAEPISPALPAVAQRARIAFAEPIGRPEDIAAAIEILCIELCAGLVRAGLGARRLMLAFYRPDGTLARLRVGTARASRDPAHLSRLFAERLDTVDPGFGIEDMVLAAGTTEPLGAAQMGLARGAAESNADAVGIDTLIDRLGNRLGPDRIRRPAMRASHLPERVAWLAPAFGPLPDPVALPPLPPRPARLLRPPEPVEVVALARPPASGEPPALFRWRRAVHRVVRAEGPERIASEWWRAEAADAAAGTRDYYRVEDADGRRFWLYREEGARSAASAWYLHGVFG